MAYTKACNVARTVGLNSSVQVSKRPSSVVLVRLRDTQSAVSVPLLSDPHRPSRTLNLDAWDVEVQAMLLEVRNRTSTWVSGATDGKGVIVHCTSMISSLVRKRTRSKQMDPEFKQCTHLRRAIPRTSRSVLCRCAWPETPTAAARLCQLFAQQRNGGVKSHRVRRHQEYAALISRGHHRASLASAERQWFFNEDRLSGVNRRQANVVAE